VRGVGLAVITLTVAAMLPIHVRAWGGITALTHALNGVVLGWLLVEASLADVRRPLVDSIPPSDGLNTVGVVLLGGAVLLVFVVSKIEAVTLGGGLAAAFFSLSIITIAGLFHVVSARLPMPAAQYSSIVQD
jgi:hypothetical protein